MIPVPTFIRASRSTSLRGRSSITSTRTPRRGWSSTSTRIPCDRRDTKRMAMPRRPMAAAARRRREHARQGARRHDRGASTPSASTTSSSSPPRRAAASRRGSRENGYRIPTGAAAVLGSYIKQNMRFFVAKVNLREQSKPRLRLPAAAAGRLRVAEVHAADPARHRERRRAAGAVRLRAHAEGPRRDHELPHREAAVRHGPAGLRRRRSSRRSTRRCSIEQVQPRGHARGLPRVRLGHGLVRPLRRRSAVGRRVAEAGRVLARSRALRASAARRTSVPPTRDPPGRATSSSRGCTSATTARTSRRTSSSSRPATGRTSRAATSCATPGAGEIRVPPRTSIAGRCPTVTSARRRLSPRSLAGRSRTSGSRRDCRRPRKMSRGGDGSGSDLTIAGCRLRVAGFCRVSTRNRQSATSTRYARIHCHSSPSRTALPCISSPTRTIRPAAQTTRVVAASVSTTPSADLPGRRRSGQRQAQQHQERRRRREQRQPPRTALCGACVTSVHVSAGIISDHHRRRHQVLRVA